MNTLKGFARRTTQTLREMVSGSELTPEEAKMAEVMTKVKTMEASGDIICDKVIQAARLMEELGTTLKDLGKEYKLIPDLPKESRELAEDVYEVGVKLMETSQEHQKGLKDNGFELLRNFSKQCAQLHEIEETRRHHQLEYDFFKSKVQDLRASPQRDFTRLPRNEQILEGWRVELWRVTERSKALCSQLYVDGRRAADRSVLTTVQVLHSFVAIASTGFAQTFTKVRLPSYSMMPVLAPTALPPTGQAAQTGLGGNSPAIPSSSAYLTTPALNTATGAPGHGYPYSTAAPGSSSQGTPGPVTPATASSVYASTPPAWAAVTSTNPPTTPPAGNTATLPQAPAAYRPPPLEPAEEPHNESPAYQPPHV